MASSLGDVTGAFLYTLLSLVGIGIGLMVFDVSLDPDRWGLTLPIGLFVVMLYPAYRYARRYVEALDRGKSHNLD